MHHSTIEDRIVSLLKSSGAGFKLANDENGSFLRSKLFADEDAAREILAEINNQMQLQHIEVEADTEGSGWYITYNASSPVKNQFVAEGSTSDNQ